MIYGKWIPPEGDQEDAYGVRRAVFVAEQGFSAETEVDARDPLSWHTVLYDDGPVATARIYYEGDAFHIGRFCVLKSHRGQGLGDLLMRMMLQKALGHYARVIRIGSQETAMPFYARYGFEVCGEPYMDEHIRHVPMVATPETLVLTSACGRDCKDCGRADCSSSAENPSLV